VLTRIYIDNYGPLVNFELEPGREQLFIGKNGSGKSSVFDAVDAVTRFAAGQGTVDGCFPSSRLTRWDTRPLQTFELDLLGPSNETYRYRLVIEHDEFGHDVVREERVTLGVSPLFASNDGDGELFGDDGSLLAKVLIDPSRSSIGALAERPDNKKLSWLRHLLEHLRVASLDPKCMANTSLREESMPTKNLSNLASWYRHLVQESPEHVDAMRDLLSEVFDGFHSLKLVTEGRSRRLVTRWKSSSGTVDFDLDELSDGQRVLIGLAALAAAEPSPAGTTLLLDEPDNFIALDEVQPLLMSLRDRTNLQFLVISHHPEVINLQAREHGLVFERHNLGPTQVRAFKAPDDSTLTPAELVARGEA